MHPEPFTTEEFEDVAMSDDELLSHLQGHETNALGYYEDQIADEQATALDYYYRRMPDLLAMEGSSQVVDGTVAIVIDNALASILKPFVSSDETVSFAPRGPEDVEIAQQATEFCNYVWQNDNAGFKIFHDWFKDALLTKIGIVKCWWEETERVQRDSVIVDNEIALAQARMDGRYQGEQQNPDGTITVEFAELVEDGKVRIENVPPEEFLINPYARSLEEASYVAHKPTNVTRSDLIAMGFDPEVVETLDGPINSKFSSRNESDRRQARYADEQQGGVDYNLGTPHESQELVSLIDEYVRIDFDGDGIAELRRIVRSGNDILMNEEIEQLPFAVLCPVPMPHKVIGLSLADQVVDLQRISTAIWRQTLDNLYKTNNPRPIIGEGAERADGSTPESVGDNSPGAEILVRDIGQFKYGDSIPFFARESFSMLEYVEGQQEARTGIGRMGQGIDVNALKGGPMTATEVSIASQGRNARAEMIARIFAETGVKDLFKLILGLLVKYQPRARMVKLRNQWVEIDPSGWPIDMDVEISVGLGMGDKNEKLAVATSMLEDYGALAQSPYSSLIGATQVYNALKMKLNAADVKNVDDFLIEPQEGEQGQVEEAPDPALLKAQAEMQMKQQQAEFDAELKVFEMQERMNLKAMEMAGQFDLAQYKADAEARLAQWKAAQEVRIKANLTDNRPGGDLDK